MVGRTLRQSDANRSWNADAIRQAAHLFIPGSSAA
jgi:hypothetical protein